MAAWYGSKATTGLCQPLIAMMPPHDVYIETHLGGGAILKRKKPALRNIGIDRNARSIETCSCGHEVELIHGCAHRFLAEFEFRGRELVYADPPYLQATRRSDRRYRHDYTDGDHAELLDILCALPCQVMISGYPSDLYDEMLEGWGSLEIQVNNQSCVVTEKLWFNFFPDRVHWASLAGRNFTHRQTVRRKAASWGRRYKAMPRSERLAVLAAMMNVEAGA